MIDAPVVLICFNRPQLLAEVWKRIAAVRPAQLVVLSDGPKSSQDFQLVEQCRAIIKPSWNCDFLPIYAKSNLGLEQSITSGLDQVFDRYEKAIVLEDDCLADPSFFLFCSELLERYKNDDRIFSITGLNQFEGRYDWRLPGDYAASRYFCSWGWASWRRNWRLHRNDVILSSGEIENRLLENGVSNNAARYWSNLFSPAKLAKMKTWCYPFSLSGLIHKKWTIFPKTNMIVNSGLASGVHFKNKIANWKMPDSSELKFPLDHPAQLLVDAEYDLLFERRHHDANRIRRVLRRMILELF